MTPSQLQDKGKDIFVVADFGYKKAGSIFYLISKIHNDKYHQCRDMVI
jgi:hypothetical protein